MRLRMLAAAFGFLLVNGIAARAQAPVPDAYLGVPVGGGPVDPGRVPTGIDSIDAAACGECHQQHLREWRTSTHRTSFTNPIFVAEFGYRQREFCANCHAPRDDEEAGVDCAVCHVRDGAVINPQVSGRAPHTSRRAAAVGGTLACARCHEFEFQRQPGELLQGTVSEWMRSEHRDTTCQGCHMRESGGHHVHDFPGGRDPALLRDAIAVHARASREGENTRLVLELSANGAGHAVPTGDMFRRLVIRAWPVGSQSREVSTTLGRRFRVDTSGWHERADQRIPSSGTRTVELVVRGSARALDYAIDLWRVPPQRADARGWAPGDVSSPLASGRVPVR